MKPLLTLLLVLLVGFSTVAQNALGIYVSAFKPLADYDQNLDQNPVGLTLSGLRQMGNERLQLGGELGVAMYANRRYSYELVDEGYPGRFVDVDEEDCFLNVHGVARYTLLDKGVISTYAEAKAGISSFFSSRYALEHNSHFKDETRFHGTAINTGIGGGLTLDLMQIFSEKESFRPLLLDIAASVNSGTKARYRNMNSDDLLVNNINHGNYRSLTNNIHFKFGLLVEL